MLELHANLAAVTNSNYRWAEEFRAFTTFHSVVLAVCVGSFIAFCMIGKRLLRKDSLNNTDNERTFRWLLAWSIILAQAFFFIRRLTPEHWDIQDSLPMHMCRWTVWIAAWAMFTLNPRMRALLLFWGLGLSTQAFFSPMITYGLEDWGFWIYWINHLQIVGAGIYDIVVLGYRPKRKDLYFAMLAGLAYAFLTIGLNFVLGTNYSYLGNGDHSATSVVDQLGPYPQRLIWMMLGSELIFVIIYLFVVGMKYIRTRIMGLEMQTMIVNNADRRETLPLK
jgi:hypothetical integral membrane protein (TIGR02206 family)